MSDEEISVLLDYAMDVQHDLQLIKNGFADVQKKF